MKLAGQYISLIFEPSEAVGVDLFRKHLSS